MTTVEEISVQPEGAQPDVDIRLVGLTKRFEDVVAVDGISLDIERGHFFALLGPSGCGKTTTLRMIGGFEEPTAGRIELGGVDVAPLPPYKRDVNTVFQSYALFPHLSIFENVAFGLRRQGVKGGDLRRRVGEALELVGLGGVQGRQPPPPLGGPQPRGALPPAPLRAWLADLARLHVAPPGAGAAHARDAGPLLPADPADQETFRALMAEAGIRPRGHAQDLLEDFARHRARQEATDRAARGDGRVHRLDAGVGS